MRTVFSLLAIITSIGLLIYVLTKLIGITTMHIVMLCGAVAGAFLGGWALSNTPITEWFSDLNTRMNDFIETAKKEYEAGKNTIGNNSQ